MDDVIDLDKGSGIGGRWLRNPVTGELTPFPDDAAAPAEPDPANEPEQEQP